jgi:hypothetical protein
VTRSRRILHAVAALVAVTALTSTPLAAPDADALVRSAAGPATGPDGPAAVVTLITGDRVRLSPGRRPAVEPRRGSPAPPLATFRRDGDWYVLPGDAGALIQAGLLDERLFNVTGLVRQAYHDGASRVVPLLLEHATSAGARRRALSGPAPRRDLSPLRLAATDQSKATTAALWRSLLAGADPGGRRLAGSLRRIWLNARIRTTLDTSVARIGAPAAHRAGWTGSGVTVAVLDTGYDADHADLAGVVTRSRDFTDSGVVDRHGHGTHVVSILAGSGAASQGRYRGVAPDADLAVGKVLHDDGSGTEETILAGMHWAVTEAHADVVNLSLGSFGPGDGTGPVDAVVNELSRRYGTLFVAAAGNRGPGGLVSSPASADAALGVANVDDSDRLAIHSSRGPRTGDALAKPDLAAPGVGISAARAAGAFPEHAGQADYAPLTGTSMSTPHVAGAAALLAQRHPDWTGERLKAALMASAAATPTGSPGTGVRGHGIFGVGAGRVDVARAVSQAVWAVPASLSASLPATPNGARTLPVTYRNEGPTPVTLTLTLSMMDTVGNAAPAGLATLAASALTVPAGGTATATVGLAPRPIVPGTYGGVLVAAGGGVSVRTPIAVRQEARTSTMTVDALGADGQPAIGLALVVDRRTGEVFDVFGAEVTVPYGDYAVLAMVFTDRPGGGSERAMVAVPRVAVGAPASSVTVDARWAAPVRLTVDGSGASGGLLLGYLSTIIDAENSATWIDPNDPGFDVLRAGTAPGVSDGGFHFVTVATLEPRPVELSIRGADPVRVAAAWISDPPRPIGGHELSAVYAGDGTPEELARAGVDGRLALVSERVADYDLVLRDAGSAGAAMVAFGPSPGGGSGPAPGGGEIAAAPPDAAPPGDAPAGDDPAPGLFISRAGAQELVDRAVDGAVAVTVTVRSPGPRYHLGADQPGAVPVGGLTYRYRPAELGLVATAYHSPVDAIWGSWHSIRLAGQDWGATMPLPTDVPARRREYFLPGRWSLSYEGQPLYDLARTTAVDIRAGANGPLVWGRAALGPVVDLPSTEWPHGPAVAREGDEISVRLSMYGDADGHGRPAHAPGLPSAATGTTRLWVDGRPVGTVPLPGWGTFTGPAVDASYRLEAESVMDTPQWPLSTRVRGAWTFRSGRTDRVTALHLLGVRIQASVDDRNTAAAGRAVPVVVTTHHAPGVVDHAVRTVTVRMSTDEGVSWHPVPVSRDGSRWLAAVRAPAGYVSLRVSAVDTAGATVEQTVVRAYRVA